MDHLRFRNAKILVVDDEPVVRQVCAHALQRKEFVPVLAENGKDALDLYRELKDEVALIISDISMPVMDGIAFVREVFESNPKANVILMTGFSAGALAPEDLEKLCAVLPKPFSGNQLIAAVEKCLDCQDRQQSEVATAQGKPAV